MTEEGKDHLLHPDPTAGERQAEGVATRPRPEEEEVTEEVTVAMAATVAPAHRAEARRQTSQQPCRLKKKHFEGVAFHHKKKVASEAAEAGGQSLF